MTASTLPVDDPLAIEQDKVRLLYANSTIGLVASLVLATVVAITHWPVIAHSILLAWWGGIALLTAARAISLVRFRSSVGGTQSAPLWFTWHFAGTALSGIVWGAGGILLFAQDSFGHQAFLSLTLAGMVAGAAPIHAASRATFLAFALPACLPIIAKLFLIGDRLHVAIGTVGLLFVGVMTGLVWGLNRGVVRIFELNAERQQAEEQVRALNQNLEHLVTDRTSKLRESEQLFRTLAEVAPVGIFRTDRSGHCLYVNARWCNIAGMGTDTAVANGWTAAIHPDDRERVAEEWAQVVRSQRPFLSEFRFQSAEQKIAWVIGQAQAEFDHQGNMVGYGGIITDITDRKLAEERNTQLAERLELATRAANIGVYDWNIPKNELIWDNRMFALYGVKKEDFGGVYDTWLSVVHPDDQARCDEAVQQALRNEKPYDIEFRIRWPDRTVHIIKGDGLVVRDSQGRPLRMTGTNYDITDRKRAEDALRASEDRYRVLYDETPTMYFKLATDGTVRSVNQFGAAQLGYRVEELVGHSVLGLFHEADKEAVVDKLTECLATPEQTGHWEFRKVRKNGQTIWVHETVRVVRASTEETVLLVSCEDITERKQVETALQTFQDQIRQMQKMEAIGQLAGGVAHDFNNILTVILGNAEVAYSTIASDHPSRANLTMILDAGNRASRLVQQILTFSHCQGLSRTVIALPPMVDEALAMLRATLPAGVELTHSCDPATPPVLADSTQIHQVVMNLCTNAWHALEGKQGLIAVDLAPVTLAQPLQTHYMTLTPGHYAYLSVRDTGCGMDPDTVTRIFDPFFTTKPVGQGTGLGLSVALGIVQGHDGAIVVNSHSGQGTTFSLYFPAAEALAQPSLPLETSPVQIQKQGCRLLYLDDERMLVDLVHAKLEPRGYQITGCTTAAEALATVSADPDGFDVVVTDYNMPGMSGLEVAQALIRIRADLPVVLVSGYLSPETHMAALAAEVKEIVYKPNMLRQLEDVVARLIDKPLHSSTSARHETDPQ